MPLVGSVGRSEWFQSGDADPSTDRRNISGADVKASRGKVLRDGFMVLICPNMYIYIYILMWSTSFNEFRKCLTATFIAYP